MVRDFEQALTSVVIRPYDDGRFVVRANGKTVYDKENTGRFPKYDEDIKPKLASL